MNSEKLHQVKELIKVQPLTLTSLISLDLRLSLQSAQDLVSTSISHLGSSSYTQILLTSSRSSDRSLSFTFTLPTQLQDQSYQYQSLSCFGVHRVEDKSDGYSVKIHNIKTELYRDKDACDLINRFKYTGVGFLQQRFRSKPELRNTLLNFVQRSFRNNQTSRYQKEPEVHKSGRYEEDFVMEEEYIQLPTYKAKEQLVSIELMSNLEEVDTLDDIFNDEKSVSDSDQELIPFKRPRPDSDSASSYCHTFVASCKLASFSPKLSSHSSIQSSKSHPSQSPLPRKKSKITESHQPRISSFYKNN